jgi:hypothetical protein
MIKKYIAEIWVSTDAMTEKETLNNIREGLAECWGTQGHFKRVRICNVVPKTE